MVSHITVTEFDPLQPPLLYRGSSRQVVLRHFLPLRDTGDKYTDSVHYLFVKFTYTDPVDSFTKIHKIHQNLSITDD